MDRTDEVTKDCFNALNQIRQLDDASMPAPEVLQARLRSFIDVLFQKATAAGFSREDANDIGYAVVALADEVALNKSETVRQYWLANLLQIHYFNENVAGEAFFTRLQTVKRDPRRHEILKVYYLALLFGFQGQYQVRGGELELMNMIDGLQRELTRIQKHEAEMLSPRGERPSEPIARAGRAGPVLWIALAIAALAVVLVLGLRVTVGLNAGSVVDRIKEVSKLP
jgi:type VI secretion system protein ImpK